MAIELFSLETLEAIAHKYGYWSVFLGIAVENTGIPLPGETITLIGGFLAGSGELVYGKVLGCAIAGAVIGDNIGYWIGKTGGWPLLVRLTQVFNVPESRLEEARRKFLKDAPKAVFWGRFVTLLRIFAGPIAGIVQMPYPQFLLCNLGGATIWALIMVTLSYFLGSVVSLNQLIAGVTQFGLVALGVIVIIASIYGIRQLIKARESRLSKLSDLR